MKSKICDLNHALPYLLRLDEEIFPKHKLVGPEEKKLLLRSRGKAQLVWENSELIAGGYYVPSLSVAGFLSEFDPDFAALPSTIYMYSIAVLEPYRRQGIGREMRQRLMRQAKVQGFTSGSSHLTINGIADIAGVEVYQPMMKRVVSNFYDEGEDALFVHFSL